MEREIGIYGVSNGEVEVALQMFPEMPMGGVGLNGIFRRGRSVFDTNQLLFGLLGDFQVEK